MPFIRKRAPLKRPSGRRPIIRRKSTQEKAALFSLFVILSMSIAIALVGNYLKNISSQMALSDASDMITATINNKINEKMSEGQYTYDYFVSLQTDNTGKITALSANMARINTLSSEILQEVIAATNSGQLNEDIPLGNLLGSNLLLGRGPKIPVKITMLTSSFADFRNEIESAGINQVKHQIILEVTVQIDVMMPWEVMSTEVVSEVLIAETVLVGDVPDAYLTLNQP
ncbi:MAG: sporulation protein YunB [Firmicutes bacterium HGW-Firmicutes-16]|nr:MAG: sporulation protein YunB [Firmicutes bacterium HGW-Firmicutes-16]